MLILLFCLTIFCVLFFVLLAKHQSSEKKEEEKELITLKNGWKVIHLREPTWKEYEEGPFYRPTFGRNSTRISPLLYDPLVFIAEVKRGDQTKKAWIRINRTFGITTFIDFNWDIPGHPSGEELPEQPWKNLIAYIKHGKENKG